MCGIAGIVDLDGFDPQLLVDMTHRVKHRGPDGFGFAFFGPGKTSPGELIHNQDRLPQIERSILGLGLRRLAILDLSASGNQPMMTGDGSLCITFNGEVYNYLELRQELEGRGHSFQSGTDTEVILHAYQEWSDSCVQHFNGMWGFAIWDRRRQRLFCSRDRFGVKPFYYYCDERHFLFASEIKQIIQLPYVPRCVNDDTVYTYLDQGLIDDSTETFFQNIFQLPGGHCLTLDLSGKRLVPSINRFWDLPIRPGRQLSESEALEEFRARFQHAVSLRMRSDVPVGSCLSGGLDSSAIVCQTRRLFPRGDFHTFSSCFEDARLDERPYIEEIVKATGIKSHFVFPRPDHFWRDFERIIWHQDEPVGSTSVYAQWCVMQEARRVGIPVLLDGQGGDETLCGYRKFYYFNMWYLLKRLNPRFFSEGLAGLFVGAQRPLKMAEIKRYLPSFPGHSSLTARVSRADWQEKYPARLKRMGAGSDLAARQKADLIALSVPALLHYEDRNSMAHSIEARVPFLDYELVEFVINCPPPLKLRNGWTKWILRESMIGTLPDKVRWRRTKLGFATPEDQWLRKDLRDKVLDFWRARSLQMDRILDPAKVLEAFAGYFDHDRLSITNAEVIRILNLETWARMFNVN